MNRLQCLGYHKTEFRVILGFWADFSRLGDLSEFCLNFVFGCLGSDCAGLGILGIFAVGWLLC